MMGFKSTRTNGPRRVSLTGQVRVFIRKDGKYDPARIKIAGLLIFKI